METEPARVIIPFIDNREMGAKEPRSYKVDRKNVRIAHFLYYNFFQSSPKALPLMMFLHNPFNANCCLAILCKRVRRNQL